MRRRSIFALAAALLVLSLGEPSTACALSIRHGQKDAKREIEELEQQWRTAQLNDDLSAMDRLLSDDYVGIGMNGTVNTKTQQLDRLRRRTLVMTRLDLTDVKVKLVGSVAIVTSLASIEGTNDGNPMSGMYRYTRVYQRLPNGLWKITNFEATRMSAPGGGRPGTLYLLGPRSSGTNLRPASAGAQN